MVDNPYTQAFEKWAIKQYEYIGLGDAVVSKFSDTNEYIILNVRHAYYGYMQAIKELFKVDVRIVEGETTRLRKSMIEASSVLTKALNLHAEDFKY